MKTIYIFEYDDGNTIDFDWFVGEVGKDEEAQAIEQMVESYDWKREDAKTNLINVYDIGVDMINDVYEFNHKK